MKKLLLLLLIYLLVEGNNVIGDGLYVYHRGKHAVNELATKVDEYYPKVQAVDTVMSEALSREFYISRTDTILDSIPKRNRMIIRR